MLGIKDLKKELAETNSEMKAISTQILKMAENVLILSKDMTVSMKNIAEELHETNISIKNSLKTTSDTIEKMSENFSKALENAMDNMAHMSMEVNVKDTLLKSLGLDNLIPDFLKKK